MIIFLVVVFLSLLAGFTVVAAVKYRITAAINNPTTSLHLPHLNNRISTSKSKELSTYRELLMLTTPRKEP